MLGLLRSRRKSPPPKLPESIRIYAIGDIHGRADLLKEIFALIDADAGRDPVERTIEVYLGDYIDRGPNSAWTLDLLIARQRIRETVCLKGNHEAFFLEVLRNSDRLDDWRQFGGLETLMSYGIQPSLKPDADERTDLIRTLAKVLPDSHVRFLRDLRLSFTCGDFFFAHAGVRPGIPLGEQTENDLLWIRSEFLDAGGSFGKFIVHGHTPVAGPDLRPNRINIDTGAFATGKLTSLAIQDTRMSVASTGSGHPYGFHDLRLPDQG